jgi:hypothetical protein
MNPALARLLIRLYPRPWRERYGAEFMAFLVDGAVGQDDRARGGMRSGLSVAANVAWSAIWERIFPTVGGTMNQPVPSFGVIVRQPSALVPIAMSLAGLALVLGHIVLYGAVREADEGTTAHLWQLLMGLQLPVLAFFAIKWLPRSPRQTLYVLGLQAVAAFASMAPVLYFNL